MKRTSIRFRLMTMMICLTTLPVITVTWIATNNTRNSVEKEIINANVSRMMWADQYLRELIGQVEDSFYTLQINKQLMDTLVDTDSPDTSTQYVTQKYIADTLYSIFYANSRKIDELILYTHSNKKTFSAGFTASIKISALDISSSPWKRMLDGPVNIYFKQSGNDIYAFHSLNRYQDQKLLGGLAVRINKKVWEEVGNILKSEPESAVFIINDEGEILSGSTKAEDYEDYKELIDQLDNTAGKYSELEFYKSKKHFIFKKRIDTGLLAIVKAVPLKTVARSVQTTITAGVATGSIFALVSVLLSILLSLHISRPIVSLAKTMRTAQISEFKIKPVQNNDEIGLLEHGYNTMMQRIKELIENEYQKNIELKNTQLAALQAQINPHFLNNTLHLIGGIALKKNVPEIYQIVRAIGSLLRYAISTESGMVPLESELKNVRNYIFIQEQRFAGRCTVNISADEDVLDCELPKLILQPILENAFEHGLQRKEGTWKIDIRIKRINSRISIIVRDNGAGIAEDKLRQLRTELQSGLSVLAEQADDGRQEKSKRIGLRNVNSRIKLHFGSKYGLRIFSRQGSGTLVLLSLPLLKRKVSANV